MLWQISPPTPDQNPYAWFLVIVLGGLGFLANRHLADKDKQIERCLAEVSTLRELASKRADKLEADIDRLRGERHA